MHRKAKIEYLRRILRGELAPRSVPVPTEPIEHVACHASHDGQTLTYAVNGQPVEEAAYRNAVYWFEQTTPRAEGYRLIVSRRNQQTGQSQFSRMIHGRIK